MLKFIVGQDIYTRKADYKFPENGVFPYDLGKVYNMLHELGLKKDIVVLTASARLLDCISKSDPNVDVLIVYKNGEEKLLSSIKNDAILGWINDLGIGSAIFDSSLIYY